MTIEDIYLKLKDLIMERFPDIAVFIENVSGKLRVHLIDGSYLDIWLSRRIPGRYAYHWEHRHVDGGLHRHDNRPHEHLKRLKTYPKHFHDGSEENIKESRISSNPIEAVMQFLGFIKRKIEEK